jgi:hypothetical protein
MVPNALQSIPTLVLLLVATLLEIGGDAVVRAASIGPRSAGTVFRRRRLVVRLWNPSQSRAIGVWSGGRAASRDAVRSMAGD